MAFRFYDPHPVFYAVDGITPAALGKLQTFSDEGCTTPYSTFNSPALDVPNEVEIDLGGDGRAEVEIWSSVTFWARLLDADDNQVWERKITSGIPAGLVLPVLEEGEFLTGDGEDYLAVALQLLPDPTGSAGDCVVVNPGGDGYILQAFPTAPEAPTLDITVGQTEFIVGDGESTTKQVMLTGIGTGTNGGGRTQTVTVVYSTPFAATPSLSITLATPGGLASGQNQPSPNITSESASGFTLTWMMGETDDDRSQFDFNANVRCHWQAFGTRVIA